MTDAPQMLKIPTSESPDIWICLPRHKCPKAWSNIEDPVVLVERNLYDHQLAGFLWKREYEKVLLGLGCEKVPDWGCLFVHRKQGLFMSLYVDDIKMAGRMQNLSPMWKKWLKQVDLGEPTSFFDNACLGCTQRKCKSYEI